MQVSVRDINFDQALRVLKKKLQSEGVFQPIPRVPPPLLEQRKHTRVLRHIKALIARVFNCIRDALLQRTRPFFRAGDVCPL